MYDGDTVFAMATGDIPAPDPVEHHAMLAAAGDTVTRAVVHGVLAATSVDTPGGRIRSYREAFSSALPPS
jgi:putative pantetheine hydrolase